MVNRITLKTLPQATAQEVYNQVKEHLLKQGRRSTDDDGDCLYRGPGGLMCSGGCLIGDDEYSTDMEGISWTNLVDGSFVTYKHHELIRDLQIIHDGYEPKDWRHKLNSIAKLHGITP